MNFAQDVQASLDNFNFIRLVRPLCVLTQGASSFITDDEIIFQGLQQFNNIGLVLSAAKDRDNTQLFKLPTTYEAVLSLILDSEYSSGLLNVAAELTAANIIRSLPIDGSLKLIERGNALETRAYSNLDRIIFLYTTAVSSISSDTSINTNSDFFFFAPDINRETILETQFDVGLEVEPVKLTGVKAVETLTIRPNEIAFIYFNVLKSEPGTPPLLNEGVTVVNNNQDIESFIYQLSSDINTLCTNVYTSGTAVYPFSNLIAEPTRTRNIDSSVSIKKSNFYKDTTTFLNKTATFSLRTFSVYLEFAARRLSTIVSREAITIRPLTIHKAALVSPYTSYRGVYRANFVYAVGDIVIYDDQGYRALTVPPLASINNPTHWQLLDLSTVNYTNNELIIRKSTYIKNYIDGLLVGKQSSSFFNYQSLQQEGPLSAIVDVNKGTTSSASAVTTGKTSIDHKVEIDTFYFSFSDPLNPFCTVAGNLAFRISTMPEGAPWKTVPILLGDQPEDVAFKLVQGILDYRISDDTKVVGAQIYKDAVYINAYKITNPEVKVVMDVRFEGVEGITVASYYHLVAPALTSFSVAPRSVAITTVLRILGSTSLLSELPPPSVGASVVNLTANKGSKMSKVQDKIGMLNDVIGSQYVWNRSNMY